MFTFNIFSFFLLNSANIIAIEDIYAKIGNQDVADLFTRYKNMCICWMLSVITLHLSKEWVQWRIPSKDDIRDEYKMLLDLKTGFGQSIFDILDAQGACNFFCYMSYREATHSVGIVSEN